MKQFLKKKDLYDEYYFNGHACVDLGLPSGTLWATCNIGATNPEDEGDYFVWGETETYYSAGGDTESQTWKLDYTDGYKWSSYFDTNDNGSTFTKYNNNGGKTELEDIDDIAVQQWGGKWRMPTYEQLKELIDNCYWVWTDTYNGKNVNGYIVYKVKSNGDKGSKNTSLTSYDVTNDTHIFIPVRGYRSGVERYDVVAAGYYWSRSLAKEYSNYVYNLNVNSDLMGIFYDERYYGFLVRAVCIVVQK